jgi:hypothetical protein
MSFDLIIKNGLVVTAADVGKYDIGVKGGKIAVLAPSIRTEDSPNAKVIDAEGGFVTVRGLLSGWLTDCSRGEWIRMFILRRRLLWELFVRIILRRGRYLPFVVGRLRYFHLRNKCGRRRNGL